jgi:hypothetical protein
MDIQIVTMSSLKIIGMGWTGPYSQGYEIPKLFDQFAAREKEIDYSVYDVCAAAVDFRKIPFDLEEAAKIDGATPMQTYFKVILPLAVPGGLQRPFSSSLRREMNFYLS